jgi:hypothetical protein
LKSGPAKRRNRGWWIGEVGASIEEIGRQVQQSTRIAADVVKQAEQIDARMLAFNAAI